MKNVFKILFALSIITAMDACRKNPCDGVITYYQIDNGLKNYIFNTGSYWIYQDTVDNIIDSQYVYEYEYLPHSELNPASTTGINDPCQAPIYADILQMNLSSIQNDIFSDTLAIAASTSINSSLVNTLSIYEHYNLPNETGIPAFILDYSLVGVILTSPVTVSTSDTFAYEGTQNTVTTGGNVFSNAHIFRIRIVDGKSTRFNNPTDLYFVSGVGIVKIVDHRPTGDVPWDLLRYHVVN